MLLKMERMHSSSQLAVYRGVYLQTSQSVDADKSLLPFHCVALVFKTLQSLVESVSNGHMMRTGPWSSGKRWSGLMNHVYFYKNPCMSASLTWGGDSMLHYGKKVSQQRQCDVLCNVLLGNLLGPDIHLDVNLDLYHLPTFLQTKYTLSQQWQSVMTVASFSKITALPVRKYFRNGFMTMIKISQLLTVPPNSPDVNLIEHLLRYDGQK